MRALNKVDVLEEELKEAKIAVHHMGGTVPADTLPERNAVLSEAQVNKRAIGIYGARE